jgi:hypothetical protein
VPSELPIATLLEVALLQAVNVKLDAILLHQMHKYLLSVKKNKQHY